MKLPSGIKLTQYKVSFVEYDGQELTQLQAQFDTPSGPKGAGTVIPDGMQVSAALDRLCKQAAKLFGGKQ